MLRIVSAVTLLDGGMGQELLRRAVGAPTPLWSAQVMLDEPELVRRVHEDFIAAGAEVITVNAYSATRCRLGPAGLEHDYERLQLLACELAEEARAGHAGVRIAGCLSPYGWSYRPELAPTYDALWPLYAETATIQAPHVDVMLCETMGSIDEARAAIRGAAAVDRPIWVSWTLADDDRARLRSGESLGDAVATVGRLPADQTGRIEAILVNCSTPEAITAAMPVLATTPYRFGGYANGFRHIVDEYQPGSVTEMLGTRHEVSPERYADTVEGWIDQGASIVGGCCEVGPAHIAELAGRLDARAIS